MTALAISDLTQTTLDGAGIFDVLMRANKAHLEDEFLKNRIKGPEYAQVYLGSMESVMRASMEFLLQQQKISLEADLLAQQILLAQIAVTKASAELAHLTAQTAMVTQQTANLFGEAANISKQGLILDATKSKLDAEVLHINQQKLVAVQQTANLLLDASNIPIQGTVITATACKLQAEFDYTVANTLKSTSEKELLVQKTATEKAQILAIGVDADSVVGKQKLLYAAQTSGFARDAEQKATKLLVDSWNVRKTVDSATNPDNAGMSDATISAFITKLRSGIAA